MSDDILDPIGALLDTLSARDLIKFQSTNNITNRDIGDARGVYNRLKAFVRDKNLEVRASKEEEELFYMREKIARLEDKVKDIEDCE